MIRPSPRFEAADRSQACPWTGQETVGGRATSCTGRGGRWSVLQPGLAHQGELSSVAGRTTDKVAPLAAVPRYRCGVYKSVVATAGKRSRSIG